MLREIGTGLLGGFGLGKICSSFIPMNWARYLICFGGYSGFWILKNTDILHAHWRYVEMYKLNNIE